LYQDVKVSAEAKSKSAAEIDYAACRLAGERGASSAENFVRA